MTWEGRFQIAIHLGDGPLRWVKTHTFRSDHREGHYPTAAFEGLTARSESVTWIGTATGSFVGPRPSRLDVRSFADGRVNWVRIPRVLSYYGVHGRARGTCSTHDVEGLAVTERAWGGDVPFDPRKLIRGRWQWDVLAFEEDTEAFAAGLAIPIPFLGSRGIRAAARLPGDRRRSYRWRTETLGMDPDGRAPIRWRGWFESGRDVLAYEARASTPLAPALEGGAFVGFDFKGEHRGRPVRGRGFCEAGGRVV